MLNHSQLYFIIIDSNDNVFGHYHPGVIDEVGENCDNNIFLFSLNSNGRTTLRKYVSKLRKISTWIYDENHYYSCCSSGHCYDVDRIDPNCSRICGYDMVRTFQGIKQTTLTGRPGYFTTVRIIVIQMKND